MIGQAPSLIDLANDVSIFKAATLVDVDLPEFEYGSPKLYCPFGELYHADGGTSKTFRIYPQSNTAWCFAGCGFFNPVRLVAFAKDLSQEGAAEVLLDATGYVPPDPGSRWEALDEQEEQVDRDALSEALKVVCGRLDPLWEVHQFEEEIAVKFRQCLELLPKVSTREQARKWINVTTAVMKNALGAS